MGKLLVPVSYFQSVTHQIDRARIMVMIRGTLYETRLRGQLRNNIFHISSSPLITSWWYSNLEKEARKQRINGVSLVEEWHSTHN